ISEWTNDRRHQPQRRSRKVLKLRITLIGMRKETQQHQQHRIIGQIEEVGNLMREWLTNNRPTRSIIIKTCHWICNHWSHWLEGNTRLLRPRHRLRILHAYPIKDPEGRIRMGTFWCLSLLNTHLNSR